MGDEECVNKAYKTQDTRYNEGLPHSCAMTLSPFDLSTHLYLTLTAATAMWRFPPNLSRSARVGAGDSKLLAGVLCV